jgi:hypothetical protein
MTVRPKITAGAARRGKAKAEAKRQKRKKWGMGKEM